jgi:hypothetical protein|tara:strand:- start:186 stop:668 length:483 start_codon:yes stop_codon:yes gene_type:complete
MPACPFAKKTWKEKKVKIEIKEKNKHYKSQLTNHLKTIDWDKHELLIFCDPWFSYDTEKFQDFIDHYNDTQNKNDIYFMGFHPSATPTIEEHAFLIDPGTEENYEGHIEYSMMLAQKFSQLQEASDKLHRVGYYKGWPKEYYDEVVKTRAEIFNKIRRDL